MSLSNDKRTNLRGAFINLIGSCFTFWKTVIYILYGYDGLNSSDTKNFILVFLIPTSFWVIFPVLSIMGISKRISNILVVNDKLKWK
jgi:hypothetical protein